MESLLFPAGALARVDLTALTDNCARILQQVRPRGVLAVVKWDAYGHGLIPCVKALQLAGVAGFGVSSPQDGVRLRRAGITLPILVMTDWVGKPPHLFLDWNLEAAVTSRYKLEYIEAASRTLGKPIPAHIKFDTGLGRVGIHHSEASRTLREMVRSPYLLVSGIYSHLAYSGPQDAVRGRAQIEIFNQIIREAGDLGLHPHWVHLANSAAAIAIPDVPGNLVRTGIALYGQPPSPEVHALLPLDPVMSLVGKISSVRRIRRGHGFPFPHYWTAPADGYGAEISFGNATGYPRSLVGKARVLVSGKRKLLVGTMSRHTSYLFTGSDKPQIGEEAVFWGKQGSETLYLYELAPLIDALPYELPTWLAKNLPREFV